MRQTLSLSAPLPPDVKLMNTLTVILSLVFVGMALMLAVSWLRRQSLFTLSTIQVQGDLRHNNAATLRTSVAHKLSGNFLTADLESMRIVFEAVPWVRHASVQREFPNRLKVVLSEHQAVALWGEEGDFWLLDNFGEVFEANQGDVEADGLPLLNGPPGQELLVLQAYQRLSPMFEDMDTTLEQLQLTVHGRWRAQIDSGAVIDLGNGSLDELQARIERFITTVTQVSARFGRDMESADLRYANGYAVRLRGVTTGGSDDEKKKR
ncbi:cell division protein FtsQ [Polaromonas sp.]|nr:cell division protein FtsQ [Polaromonas sp.]